jgi:hypothetical protein
MPLGFAAEVRFDRDMAAAMHMHVTMVPETVLMQAPANVHRGVLVDTVLDEVCLEESLLAFVHEYVRLTVPRPRHPSPDEHIAQDFGCLCLDDCRGLASAVDKDFEFLCHMILSVHHYRPICSGVPQAAIARCDPRGNLRRDPVK